MGQNRLSYCCPSGNKENFIVEVLRESNLNVLRIIVTYNFLGVAKTKPHLPIYG